MASKYSTEDVEKLQSEVAKLREQIVAEESKRLEREAEQTNLIRGTQLEAEKAALLLDLQRAKQAASASAIAEGASAPVQAAKDSMEAALAAQKAEQKEAAKSTPAAAATTGEGS